MDNVILTPNVFSQNLRELEITDKAKFDTFNTLFKQLINNDAYIKSIVESGSANTPILSYGMNSKIVNVGKVSAFPKVTFTGQSYVNLLGKDGNCEDLSKWLGATATTSLDTTKKVFGNNGLKITLTGAFGTAYSGFYPITNSKYYLVTASILNGNATKCRIEVNNQSDATLKTSSSEVTSTTTFNRIVLKLQPSELTGVTSIRTKIRLDGSSTQYAYADGIMLNEISAEEFALTDAQLLAKYPYVDSYACLQNPYIEVKHDNLVRNGNGEEGIAWWKVMNIANTTFSFNSGKFQNIASSGYGGVTQIINCKANTDYYIKSIVTNALVRIYDGSGNILLSTGNVTFNSGIYTQLMIYITATTTALLGTVDSIQLIEGTIAPTTYLPCRIERAVIEGQFTSDDTVTLENGKVSGLVNWKHKTLYGKDFDWQIASDFVGFKVIYGVGMDIPNTNATSDYNKIQKIKYDGKVILTGNSVDVTTKSDVIYCDGNHNLKLSISDTDTGWAETIAPNNDEVKAFMNGWKAYWNNGTRYTLWLSVIDFSLPFNTATVVGTNVVGQNKLNVSSGANFIVGDVVRISDGNIYTITAISTNQLTLNTNLAAQVIDGLGVLKYDTSTNLAMITYCKNNVAPNYQGYQLHYKLANPQTIIEGVDFHVEGDIPKIDAGDNYVTIDSGMVLGEVNSPQIASTGYHDINMNNIGIGLINNTLKNKTEIINSVYKNLIYDDKWTIGAIDTVNANGKYRAYVTDANFDTSATYTVDYKILLTQAPQVGVITCSFVVDIVNAVNNQAKAINNNTNDIDGLDRNLDLTKKDLSNVGTSVKTLTTLLGGHKITISNVAPVLANMVEGEIYLKY